MSISNITTLSKFNESCDEFGQLLDTNPIHPMCSEDSRVSLQLSHALALYPTEVTKVKVHFRLGLIIPTSSQHQLLFTSFPHMISPFRTLPRLPGPNFLCLSDPGRSVLCIHSSARNANTSQA
ncbi:hypothetical protein M758_9G063700 [Ceratodon purpureus]|uniref:Uncharacterized protein n=1 Tax=Ceratodon purpureus TaxID=3225 RepID=A0A8T0GTB7_CERPU|nr:hypothetical protein KC19_9G077800 [Ceratodon purpureus]KAG0605496.1 hypothetical protein M758_9G063700 [Ceratodon purpureus]